VAISLSSQPIWLPFTLAPSRAPAGPALPFGSGAELPLDDFAALVVALERNADPAPWFARLRLDSASWSQLSRNYFARSMNDQGFATALDAALQRARRGQR